MVEGLLAAADLADTDAALCDVAARKAWKNHDLYHAAIYALTARAMRAFARRLRHKSQNVDTPKSGFLLDDKTPTVPDRQ